MKIGNILKSGYSLAIIACLLCLASGICSIAFSPHQYFGKEIFHSNQEYVEFKEAVANPDVTINDIKIIASNPPIVVTFSVYVPKGEIFPYGYKSSANLIWGYIFIGGGAIGFILTGLHRIRECKQEAD